MAQLFNRRTKLVLPEKGLSFEGLRTAFSIKKTLEKEPNTATVKIFNLAERSRDAVASRGTRLILEAGYEGSTAVVFSGDTTFVDHTHEGADWITRLECADGEVALQFSRVSEAFNPNTTKAQIFNRLVSSIPGVDAGAAIDAFKGQLEQFVSGYVAHGKASAELDKLLKRTGFKYSIQDNRLQILKEGQATSETAIYLTPSSGLVGSPQHGSPIKNPRNGVNPTKPQVLKAKSLLQPGLTPGRRVVIDSASIKKGTFLINAVEHTGDTSGAEWYSELELVPFNG